MKKIINKYKEIILYGFFGVITVIINLLLYKLFLEINIYYVIASILSYVIASLISYYFNTFFVFHSEKLNTTKEIVRIIKYFIVRIWALLIDTLLLIVAVELLKIDQFYAKIVVSIVVILFTYVFNKKILKSKGKK